MLIHDDPDVVFLVGEASVPGSSFPHASEAAAATPTFKFGRMFGDLKDTTQGEAAGLKVAGLIELGTAMDKSQPPSGPPADHTLNDSVIPAGYTYLGQFIAHEITFDGNSEKVLTEEVNLDELSQLRSPMIDLDSLYGGKPEIEGDRLYEADNVRMKAGPTLISNWLRDPPFDLPRGGAGGQPPRQALIGDPRNDENLPTAQTHLAFLKFHNKVADWLDARNAKANHGPASFADVRRAVIRHFQWIVLKDYLPRLIDVGVLQDVLSAMRDNDGRLLWWWRSQVGRSERL